MRITINYQAVRAFHRSMTDVYASRAAAEEAELAMSRYTGIYALEFDDSDDRRVARKVAARFDLTADALLAMVRTTDHDLRPYGPGVATVELYPDLVVDRASTAAYLFWRSKGCSAAQLAEVATGYGDLMARAHAEMLTVQRRAHTSVSTADGHGAHCATCGETTG